MDTPMEDSAAGGELPWMRILLPEWVFKEQTAPIEHLPAPFPIADYATVIKLYEEKRLARVLTREYNGFMVRHADGSCSIADDRELRRKFVEQKFTETVVENGEERVVRKDFIPVYIRDEEKRVYYGISYDPRNTNPWMLQVVPNIQAEGCPRVLDDGTAFMKPIWEYSEFLFEDAGQRRYFWAYLAHLVQTPARKTGVALVLQGRQGVGKNIFLLWFGLRVLGDGLFFQCGGVHSVYHSHSIAQKGKVLLLIDEISRTECVRHKDDLKNTITSDTVMINEKFKSPMRYRNLCNLVMTTNNANTAVVEADDRRYCFLDCGESKRENVAYFTWLAGHLAQDGAARAVYDALMAMDVSAYEMRGWAASRPISKRHQRAKMANISPVAAFLNWWCGTTREMGDNVVQSGMKVTHQLFKQFMADVDFENWKQDKWSLSAFTSEMDEWCETSGGALTRARRNTGNLYMLKPKSMRDYLERAGVFHEVFFEYDSVGST